MAIAPRPREVGLYYRPLDSLRRRLARIKGLLLAGTADRFGDGDQFGVSIALSDDGRTLAVGAISEDSNAPGINGNQADNSATSAGAVYAFTRTGKRFAVLMPAETQAKATETHVTLVMNFFDEVRRRVAARGK